MANWVEAYKEDLESGEFYDQGATEVTLPRGFRVVWLEKPAKHPRAPHVRPEMDIKDRDKGQPEVHAGRFSGVGFHRFAKLGWYMISSPINVEPGLVTRAKAVVMVEAHGIEGNPNRPGSCGLRVGIVDAEAISVEDDNLEKSTQDATNFASSYDWYKESEKVLPQIDKVTRDIPWSMWWVVRDNLDNERIWKQLQTDEPDPRDPPRDPFKPRGKQVRLILQCNADVATAISAGHYDDLIVEQDRDSASGGGGEGRVKPKEKDEPKLDRAALIDAALALQAQAKVLLEMDPPMVAAALELQKQAGILLQMAK